MMKLKPNFLVICLIILSVLLSGCELYEGLYGGEEEEGPVYIPIEEIIVIEEEEAKGTATLDSIEEKVTVNVRGLEQDESYNYEVWLIDDDTSVQLSIGKFDVDENGDGELIVDISKDDILGTDSIIITKEHDPDDSENPSDVIVLEESIPESADVIDIKLKAVEEELVEVIVIEGEESEEEVEEETEEVGVEVIIEGEEETEEEVTEEIEEETEEEVVEEVTEEVEEEIEEETEEEVVEEVVEEEVEPEGAANVLIIDETELVKLKPSAYDPDQDELTYAFTSPLDEKGEWQTRYGDEGEYTVTVTVSDGVLSTSIDVLLIVNKKEEAPVIEGFSPKSEALETDENSELDFSVTATDLNNDDLVYSWKLDGEETSTKQTYTYETSYDDAGAHTVQLVVSDGTSNVENEWAVTVDNVNREPVLSNIEEINLKETETVTIQPEATDPDGDALTYTISEPVGDDGTWETSYDDAGTYTITVSASDGVDEDTQTVKITVEDVNRPPVIEDIVLG